MRGICGGTGSCALDAIEAGVEEPRVRPDLEDGRCEVS